MSNGTVATIAWIAFVSLISVTVLGLKREHEEKLSTAGLQQCIVGSNIIWQRECEK